METANHIKPGRARPQTRRTVVFRPSSAGDRWQQIIDKTKNAATAAWDRLPKRVRAFLIRLTEPRVLFVLGLFAAAVSIPGIHYYLALSHEIDRRLQGNFFDDSAGIFTAPLKVNVGDRFSAEELAAYLADAGYQLRDAIGQSQETGQFAIKGGAVELSPGQLGQFFPGATAVRIQSDNGGRVSSIKDLRSNRLLQSAVIEGEMLTSIKDGDRRQKTEVQFTDIPPTLRDAILAIEDRRFFTHSGVDWFGIARALWKDVRAGDIVAGGSTITQQLIKNAFLTKERTVSRKIKEAAMALILESRLSKEDIFTRYCNDIYLGQSGAFAVHGVAEAAQVYFDKSLADLTLAESAFLAGLIHAPNRYTEGREISKAIERRNVVLDAMVETEAITREQAERAKQEPLQISKQPPRDRHGASYFIDYVQSYLEGRYGAEGMISPQRIYTTVDPLLQRAAHAAVKRHTEKLDRLFARSVRKGNAPPRVEAALVALDAHTGEVLAMVGGRDYHESQFNRATSAKRQPGSAFKPFVYAAALNSRDFTAATMIADSPQTFEFDGGRAEYKPSNYHGAFTNRKLTLREAFMRSSNVPAVEVAMRVGLGTIAELAEDCGMERPRPYPSMALGTSEVTPLEFAGAYTAFVNDGMAVRPTPVRKIDRAGSNASLSATSVRVFSPQVAYLMTDLMQSVVDAGTGARLRGYGIRGAVAGKTGTSDDGWFAGYTPGMVCVVWVGFDDKRDMGLKSSESALPLWAEFMKEALAIRPELSGKDFNRPGGVVTVAIDPETGLLASPECPRSREEIFLTGTEPFNACSHFDYLAEDSLSEMYPYPSEFDGEDDNYGILTVEVCAETGELASYQCPKAEKTFEVGKEPREFCRVENHAGGKKDKGADGERRDRPPTDIFDGTALNPPGEARPKKKRNKWRW